MGYLWLVAAIGFLGTGIYTWISGDRRQALSDLLLVPILLMMGMNMIVPETFDNEIILGIAAGLAAAGIILHLRRAFQK